MIGQAYSAKAQKYNVIILAAGLGSRMGNASDYIPKPLTPVGTRRAIDWIIDRYSLVAGRIIVGTGYHADLLESYVKGRYHTLPIFFVQQKPENLLTDGITAIYCMDQADCRMGTIITYCDMIVPGNVLIRPDSILVATPFMAGHVGTFRTTAVTDDKDTVISFNRHNPPIRITEKNDLGVMGQFICDDSPRLKALAYAAYSPKVDLTYDIIRPYSENVQMKADHCETAIDFGTEEDLAHARRLWEGL